MKRLVFLVIFLLFTGGNSMVVSLAVDKDNGREMSIPIGDEEENQGEESESKNLAEDDDEVGLDHYWLSRGQTIDANLHFLYQETLFNGLEIEVVVPPPKA